MPHKDPKERDAYLASYRDANREKLREKYQKWYRDNPERAREYRKRYHQKRLQEDLAGVRAEQRRAWLAHRYGMTEEGYSQIWDEQQGCCAICSVPAAKGEPLHVDHDHETGAVRGLLCGHCNRAIGLVRDDPVIAKKAAGYLDRHWRGRMTQVVEQWHSADFSLFNGDSTDILKGILSQSVGLSVYSPPFQNLYTYSASERDLGNCRTEAEFATHFGFIISELLRVTMPGRISCCHVQQIATQKAKDGVIGLKDFRGDVIRLFQERGWIWQGEVCIDRCPQAQAIRTKAKSLLFVQLRKDASWMRPALADYLLLFRAPGENPAPVHPDVDNEEWICWARPIWYNIRETHTLNVSVARQDEDERHVCPLQLDTIERAVRLWSNRGDVVLDPFAGIGSTGYVAIQHGRRFVGVELKRQYAEVAARNLREAEAAVATPKLPLFDDEENPPSDVFSSVTSQPQ